ncbi:MAG TPA: glycosyltransferase family 4 protein [Acidimicrobiales bacterium]|nr:glycosyltransferase family 4 protein [Acidimicrobiales bacterium]
MRHVLLTNDFPPKVGGIQSYLWELWRRLPPDDVTVFTASHAGAAWWDREQKFRVIRAKEPVLLPQPHLVHRVRQVAESTGAQAVVIDPALPLGLVGPSLGLPYAVVLHGAEVTVPGRLPVSRQLLQRVLKSASLVIAAGGYPEAEARRAFQEAKDQEGTSSTDAGGSPVFPPAVQIPPGVDTDRFRPLPHIERAAARARLKLPVIGPLVASVSRLVPRKGMDTLIEAAAMVARDFPGLSVAIAGGGRDRHRLERLASRTNVRVDFLGKVPDADLPDFYACADVFALCCRSRWWGLEQEGFGVVLVEAAAAGIPCITIDSGGAGEAVRDGETGIVAVARSGAPEEEPSNGRQRAAQVGEIAEALTKLLGDPGLARRMGEAGRRRAEEELSYDALAAKLGDAIDGLAALEGPPALNGTGDGRMAEGGRPGSERAGVGVVDVTRAEGASSIGPSLGATESGDDASDRPRSHRGRYPGRAAWQRRKQRTDDGGP